MPIPFWSGKNARIVFFQDNDQVVLDVITWSVRPNVVKANDGVCGEDRDRLQTIINHYDISLECKQQKLDGLKALLADQENIDLNSIPLEKSVGFLIYPNDGTQAAFQAKTVVVDDWEFASGGRTERNQLTIPLRSQRFLELPI